MQHAAIPTTYKGVRFRSRLEARWGAMFDQLGWTWHYEPIDLNGWIPDFLVSTPHATQILVEVKPITAFCQNTANKMEKALGYSEDKDTGEFNPDHAYEAVLVGAIAPVQCPDDRNSIGWLCDLWGYGWCNAVINRPDHGIYGLTSGMNGCFRDRILLGRPHKESLRPVYEEDVAELWARATNTTQWKAPK